MRPGHQVAAVRPGRGVPSTFHSLDRRERHVGRHGLAEGAATSAALARSA